MRRVRRVGLALATAWLLLFLPVRTAGAAASEDSDDQALLADADYAAGRVALKAGDVASALPRLQAALKRFPDAADVHNELGFAHRKMRQMDKSFEHYKRALAIKPNHRSAHEYIGEAYLLIDDLAGAERHVAALRLLCLVPCDELKDLENEIAAFKAINAARSP